MESPRKRKYIKEEPVPTDYTADDEDEEEDEDYPEYEQVEEAESDEEEDDEEDDDDEYLDPRDESKKLKKREKKIASYFGDISEEESDGEEVELPDIMAPVTYPRDLEEDEETKRQKQSLLTQKLRAIKAEKNKELKNEKLREIKAEQDQEQREMDAYNEAKLERIKSKSPRRTSSKKESIQIKKQKFYERFHDFHDFMKFVSLKVCNKRNPYVSKNEDIFCSYFHKFKKPSFYTTRAPWP